MKCEKCGKGLGEVASLLRQNPKGEAGVWRCEACNGLPIDSELAQVIAVIERANQRGPLQ